MTSEIGNKLKEARTAAGMTQSEVAKAAEGVSVKALSNAERGISELSPEQLEAVAKAIGVPAASLTDAVPEAAPAASEGSADVPVYLTEKEQELLTLFRTADTDKQSAAFSIFKEGQQIPLFMKMLMEIYKGDQAGELFQALKSMVFGSKVEDLINMVKGLISCKNGSLMGAFTGFAGPKNTGASENGTADVSAGQGSREISVPLLAFTYFYSASIYILLLSFYFWQWRTDIKPEK